ncbi:class I adenylate-forming enzyme family protein [Streptomyces sp. HU2014]|uniref:class I adenylate-forming enzyme family protein n=1 Tax=Streptomyces sp. HU2014 TaxID=2939414 RepID=UPI0024B369ED|nr:class I adenylate-forming enzyme family protein [Streptomyces sp. HU2014]
MSQLLHRILSGLGRDPRGEALVHENRRLTHGEVLDMIHRFAHVLTRAGIGPGRTVATLHLISPEAVALRLAVQLLGGCYVPLSTRVPVPALVALARTAGATDLVFAPACDANARAVRDALDPRHVLSLGPADHGQDLLAAAARAPARAVPPGGRETDPALIMCTSGSTGLPKTPVHTFAGLTAQQHMDRWLRRDIPGGPARRFLHHARDMLSPEVEHVIWTLAAGGSAVLLGDVGPSQVIEALDRERVTHLYCMPRLLEELTAEIGGDPAGAARYPHLRQVEYGSAPADRAIVGEALDAFGPRLVQVYASSETAYVTALGTDEHTPGLWGSVGKPLPGVTVRIGDEEAGAAGSADEGDIWVRSPAAMTEYRGNPVLTASSFRGGWFRTGDRGRVDSAGYLRLTGRESNKIIVASGLCVYAHDVEAVLASHPGVRQASVFGVPDARLHETVHAAVVRADGATTGAHELTDYVRNTMGERYTPSDIRFLPELPLTRKGQPDRSALRDAIRRR